MKLGRIIIITGSPGTGKSTVASIITKESSFSKAVHIRTDDFYNYIQKGGILPFLPESQEQNQIVTEAFLKAADRFVNGGYEVIIDGIVTPSFLNPWLDSVKDKYEVHFIILKATKEETMKRLINRTNIDENINMEFLIDFSEKMRERFNYLGAFMPNTIDTTDQSKEGSVATINAIVEKKSCLLNQS